MSDTVILPLLPLRDIVVFPESLQALFVGRPRSVAALETAIRSTAPGSERRVVLSAQRTARTEEPGADDIHAICAIGVVKTLLPLQNSMMKVLVAGEERARIKRFALPSELSGGLPAGLAVEPFVVEVERISATELNPDPAVAQELLTRLQASFEEFARLSKRWQPEIPKNVAEIPSASRRADVIAGYVPIKPVDKQALLEEMNVEARIQRLTDLIDAESELVQIGKAHV